MLRSPNRTPQNYKEKFSKHDFFKKRGQNILKLTDSVEKGQNFWNLGVSIGETFFGLTVPSQIMCAFDKSELPWASADLHSMYVHIYH